MQEASLLESLTQARNALGYTPIDFSSCLVYWLLG